MLTSGDGDKEYCGQSSSEQPHIFADLYCNPLFAGLHIDQSLLERSLTPIEGSRICTVISERGLENKQYHRDIFMDGVVRFSRHRPSHCRPGIEILNTWRNDMVFNIFSYDYWDYMQQLEAVYIQFVNACTSEDERTARLAAAGFSHNPDGKLFQEVATIAVVLDPACTPVPASPDGTSEGYGLGKKRPGNWRLYPVVLPELDDTVIQKFGDELRHVVQAIKAHKHGTLDQLLAKDPWYQTGQRPADPDAAAANPGPAAGTRQAADSLIPLSDSSLSNACLLPVLLRPLFKRTVRQKPQAEFRTCPEYS